MIVIKPANISELPDLCRSAGIKYKEGYNAFCLRDKNKLQCFCIFDVFNSEIITSVFYSNDEVFKTALIKAVLNHFDLIGKTEVICSDRKNKKIFYDWGFTEIGGILRLSLDGYFDVHQC